MALNLLRSQYKPTKTGLSLLRKKEEKKETSASKDKAKEQIRQAIKGLTIKKTTLPEHLGRGSFLTGETQEGKKFPIIQPRTWDKEFKSNVRGGSYADIKAEVDHIISLGVGGTNEPYNARALENKPDLVAKVSQFILGNPNWRNATGQQSGKVDIEKKAINKYRAGEISLPEARAAIINWNNNPEVFLHEEKRETALEKYYQPEKAWEKIKGFFAKPEVQKAKELTQKTNPLLRFLESAQKVGGIRTDIYTGPESQILRSERVMERPIGPRRELVEGEPVGFERLDTQKGLAKWVLPYSKQQIEEEFQFAPTVGEKFSALALGALSYAVTPGGADDVGKIAKFSKTDDILRTLKGIFKGVDDEILRQSDELLQASAKKLTKISDEKIIAKEIDTLGRQLDEAVKIKQAPEISLLRKLTKEKTVTPKPTTKVTPLVEEAKKIELPKRPKAPTRAPKSAAKVRLPEPIKHLEPLAVEARKFKSAEDFIQSSRLANLIKQDTAKLQKIKALSKKEAEYIYEFDIERYKGLNNFIKKIESDIKATRVELDKLPENKLATQMPGLFKGLEQLGKGWFERAKEFYKIATQPIPTRQAREGLDIALKQKKLEKAITPAVKAVEPPKVPKQIQAITAKRAKQMRKTPTPKQIREAEIKKRGISTEAEAIITKGIKQAIKEGEKKEIKRVAKEIGEIRVKKNLSSTTMGRLYKVFNIKGGLQNASKKQMEQVKNAMKSLKEGDSFLTDKQITGLESYIKVGKFDKDSRLITKREMIEKFKENEDLLTKGVLGFLSDKAKIIPTKMIPTVDIKEAHPVIRQVVDKADIQLRKSVKKVENLYKDFNDLLSKAEKARPKGTKKYDIGENIFRSLSGEKVILTSEERAVADYMKNYFKEARETLQLEKYRKNYITHIEKPLMEKIRTQGLNKALQSYMKPESNDIPVDVYLALDNIIGSEKFFKFALQRKGGLDPTKDLWRIFSQYSNLVETKKALDKVLPEGQAAVQLLLEPRSAKWLMQFLQNIKGRALDMKFRDEMGGVAKIADKIVDIGYIRLLGLNIGSAIKNIIGGEVNSFVYQTFTKYAKGKARLIKNPKKAYKIISSSGVLDGSYADLAAHNLLQKGQRITNHILYGTMEATEYEIKGSYLLGEMTEAEWKTGKLSEKRFREILDGITITQGIYTKVDSPLFVQTVLGRAVMQFGRWKIINALLFRRIAGNAARDLKAGRYNTKDVRSFLKMLTVSGIGMYLSYEAGKAGMKEAQKYAQAAAELINTMTGIVTFELVYDALANNPALESMGAMAYSMQALASYISFGIVEEPRSIEFRNGIEDSYIAAFKTLGIDTKEEKSKVPQKPKEGSTFAPSGTALPSFALPKQGLPSFKVQ